MPAQAQCLNPLMEQPFGVPPAISRAPHRRHSYNPLQLRRTNFQRRKSKSVPNSACRFVLNLPSAGPISTRRQDIRNQEDGLTQPRETGALRSGVRR